MTANAMPTFTFNRGGAAAEEADKATSGVRTSTHADFFSLKDDGEATVIRLLTDHDDWIYVGQHSFVPTKPGPKDAERWPETMMAVCRHDQSFGGYYKDCYICDAKLKNRFGKVASSRVRLWALAVEREVVKGDGSEALGGPERLNTIVGIRDKIDEIHEVDDKGEETGNILRYPRILVINQPMKGFFASLKSLYGLHNTLCDRDYTVTREGTGTDTSYRFTAIDPVPDVKPGTPAWEKWQQVLTEREISLEQMVAHRASDEYFAKWFDPSKRLDKDGKVVASDTPVNLPADEGSAPTGYSADLRDRIRNLGAPTG